MVDHVRFIKFGVVGVANTVIAVVVFNLAAVVLHVPAVAANAIGWAAGFLNSFIWNRRWTFADRTGVSPQRAFGRFGLGSLAALSASSLVIALLQPVVMSAALTRTMPKALALNLVEAVAIVVSLSVNYAIATRWAFREDPSGS